MTAVTLINATSEQLEGFGSELVISRTLAGSKYIKTIVKLLHYIVVISIGPIIEPPVQPRYNIIVNVDEYKNGVTEIDLPIIGTGNGPFRLVDS